MENHWQWRPEWRTDRPCLYWYLTFAGQESLRSLSHSIRPHLHRIAGVDAVPTDWLHLTVQDVGFCDELPEANVQTAVQAAARAIADLRARPLTLGPVTTMGSAVVLAGWPADHLRRLRNRLREAMAAVGLTVPGPDEFRPHVSLGYVNRDCDERTVMERLRTVRDLTTTLHAPRLTLAAVTRRDRHYQWRSVAELPLDGQGATSQHAMSRGSCS